MRPFEAVLSAAKIRLRPRVMTTMTTIAGFIPLALNLGEGGDLLQPMAVGAIGGLVLEIFAALFLMPALYLLFARDRATDTVVSEAKPAVSVNPKGRNTNEHGLA
jgi:multidrug efflux pump subunit AcrB